MAEEISKKTYSILNRLPYSALKFLKLNYRYIRFYKALNFAKNKVNNNAVSYNNQIIFVAGLPKSGTTWLENMLGSFNGYTIIPDPKVTEWDYKYNGTHNYQLNTRYFQKIQHVYSLVKVHCSGSEHNVNVLKELKVPYCIMYRDLRDAAVSYVFYVKRTPWHPEYPIYKNMTIEIALLHFGNTLLSQWKDWILEWKANRDPKYSMIIRYEDLLEDTKREFAKVLFLFDLPSDNLDEIIDTNKFSKKKNRSSFYRKGVSGNWKEHFTPEITEIYKEKIAEFLIREKYEINSNW